MDAADKIRMNAESFLDIVAMTAFGLHLSNLKPDHLEVCQLVAHKWIDHIVEEYTTPPTQTVLGNEKED